MFQPPVNREVTAADVKYSIERSITCPRSAGGRYFYPVVGFSDLMDGKTKHLTGITTPDKYTVSIRLTQPCPGFPYVLGYQFSAVVAKEWVAKWHNNLDYHPLGTGPYMLDTWKHGQEMILKKNPNYHGIAYVDAYDIKYGISPTTAAMMVKSGTADIMFDNVSTADLPGIKADPNWTHQLIVAPAGNNAVFLYLNTKMAPTNNPALRQAIAWAINRDKLVKLQGGAAIVLNQLFTGAMTPWEPNANYVGYDPEKSKKILADAGLGGGINTKMYVYSDMPPIDTVFQSIQSDLAAVGIHVDIVPMAKNALFSYRMKANTTPMGSFTWAYGWPDPWEWFDYWCNADGIYPGGWNPAFYVNKKLDAKIMEAENAIRSGEADCAVS